MRRYDAKALVIASGLLLFTLLGVNAIWGRAGPRHTLISAWQSGLAPPIVWIAGAAVILGATGAGAYLRHRPGWQVLSATLLAYLAGVGLAEWLRAVAAGWSGTSAGWPGVWIDRALTAIPALPMLAAVRLSARGITDAPLRFGRWREGGSEATRARAVWGRRWWLWVVAVFLPLAIAMQASVRFEPVSSGRLWAVLLPLVVLALVNATGEELIFRGLALPALLPAVEERAALWLQALFFGLHHWGSAPEPISTLPTVFVLTLVGWVWGRSVLRTGGIGWAVLTHASLDCALFFAHFVPEGPP